MLLQPNDIFAQHYRLTKLIGDGGFAYVWLAEDMRIEERCAIKIYKEHILTDGIMDEHRFRAIMRRLYNIDNPNILTPKDFGNDKGMLYYVMRYLRGGSISRYAGRMSEKDIWEFLKQTAAGLEHLHSKHLVHRDIKPANIMIDSDSSSGTVYKIADFDTAASVDYTKTRVDAGSQPYQAPECFDSSIAATDETKLDVWALGASVYELITGVTPFGNFGGLSQGSGREIPAIQQNISPNLKNLIYSCLDPDPDNRPFAREIYKVCKNRIVAYPPRIPPSVPPPDDSPQSPNFWKPVIITLLCVVASVAVAFLFQECPSPKYHLTVQNGSGSGDYEVSTSVTVKANEPESGEEFASWTGNTASIANVDNEKTTFKMGNSNATIIATYRKKTDQKPTTYLLTVYFGSGNGRYEVGNQVKISANPPPYGQVFDRWEGDIAGVADVTSSVTTYTIGNKDARIEATYKSKQTPKYHLTVINGSGSGDYDVGTRVTIIANVPKSNEEFDRWTGNTSSVANVTGEKTTFIMGNLNATIIATYRKKPDPSPAPKKYTLTVYSGSGSGQYEAGKNVLISANQPPEGKIFDSWEGDINGVANVYSPNTTYTMGTADARIQAKYKQKQTVTTTPPQPDPCSYNDLGKAADAKKDYTTAFNYFEQGAQQGCNLAMYNLGRYYAIGPGSIKKNKIQAKRWLEQALNNGVPEAQNLIDRYGL